MEILLLIAIGAVAVFWIVSRMNKDNDYGGHPLDSIAKDLNVNNKTGDVVEPVLASSLEVVKQPEVAAVPTAVNDQITDSVTQVAPAKKSRKPRTPKVEKVVKEKAAKPVKAAAITNKVAVKRSKKA